MSCSQPDALHGVTEMKLRSKGCEQVTVLLAAMECAIHSNSNRYLLQ